MATGFSRNFLGVHTPQDVVVGFLSSVIIIMAVGKAEKRLEGDGRKLDILFTTEKEGFSHNLPEDVYFAEKKVN